MYTLLMLMFRREERVSLSLSLCVRTDENALETGQLPWMKQQPMTPFPLSMEDEIVFGTLISRDA